MSVNKNGNLRPDGISVAVPLGPIGLGGAYYWNPGSPDAPSVTLTGGLGRGGGGVQGVFLRKGMTSRDTLGYGATATIPIIPSATLNASIPDQNGIPQPFNARLSSFETGLALPGAAGTYTATPQQLAEHMTTHGLIGAARLTSALGREALTQPHPSMHFISPAMGPEDELPPSTRTLQSGQGTVGPSSEPPIRYLTSRYQNPLGGGMGDWRSSTGDFNSQQPAPSAPLTDEPGGLLGMLLDHLRDN